MDNGLLPWQLTKGGPAVLLVLQGAQPRWSTREGTPPSAPLWEPRMWDASSSWGPFRFRTALQPAGKLSHIPSPAFEDNETTMSSANRSHMRLARA